MHLPVGELAHVRATGDALAFQMFEDSLTVDGEGRLEGTNRVACFVPANELRDPRRVEAKLLLEGWGSAENDPDVRHGHREQALHP